MPSQFLRQGNQGTVLLVNTHMVWKSFLSSWGTLWFLQSLIILCNTTAKPLNIKSISWPDGPPLITESHYRKSLFQIFENADRAQIWEHLQYWSARETKASTDTQHLRQRLSHWKQIFLWKAKGAVKCMNQTWTASTYKQTVQQDFTAKASTSRFWQCIYYRHLLERSSALQYHSLGSIVRRERTA